MSRRIRKHANPFNVTTELGRLDRLALFGREAPVEVDLGCGGGALITERARRHPGRDFVGLEVRRPLVEQIRVRAQREGLSNLSAFHANVHINVRDLIAPGEVVMFHVHFPDPCFKKKHRKRRILQPPLVRAMAEVLPIGGVVYAQSDVEPLAQEMLAFLEREPALRGQLLPAGPPPIPEQTEWERQHEREAEPIHRLWFEKVAEPSGPVEAWDLVDVRPPEKRP
ncbi:MAG: tRNA (guanosine(46)-N7)-methyltransferase TrmB [Myxococcota bacterium]